MYKKYFPSWKLSHNILIVRGQISKNKSLWVNGKYCELMTFGYHKIMLLLWSDIKLSWKLHLSEQMLWIFIYINGIVTIM